MTQTPYGGQSYAATGTPYGAPSLDQQPPAAPSVEPWAVPSGPPAQPAQPTTTLPGPGAAGGFEVPAGAPTGDGGFSEPVITEVKLNPAPTDQAPEAAPVHTPRPRGSSRARGPRRARLQLRHINPWTVLKFSCVLSIALFFVWLITIGVLFGILDAAGVIGKINDTVTKINGSGSNNPITPGIVFGGAAIIGVVNIVLFIALSTVGSVVYNLCADLVGGVEVTLSEREA